MATEELQIFTKKAQEEDPLTLWIENAYLMVFSDRLSNYTLAKASKTHSV